jgi:threonine dehydratase
VIGVSAGNHAQALAWCARYEGLDALLVMWGTASPAKVAATEAYGAEIDLAAEGPETVFDRLHELIEQTGRTLVHPFDDPVVVAGQGTVGLEIAEDVPYVDTVVVPVGGGGLVAGIASALPDVRIVGVEPSSSNALTVGLAANEPTPVRPRSIADGLNAPFAGEVAIRVARERGVQLMLVEDEEIEEAMRFLYGRAKLACEPAGAAGVAAIRSGRLPLEEGENVVVVVSGGNVSGETAAAILARP